MRKIIKHSIFYLVLTTTVFNLQAQMVLTESDMEARRQLYKSEMEHRQQRYRQAQQTLSMESYDAIYYKLEFNIGIEPDSFHGKATEKFICLVDDLDTLDLDFDSYLPILDVEGDAVSNELNDYLLSLELNKTFNIGDTIEVVIEYQGIPRSEGDYAGFWFGIHRKGPGDTSVPVVYTLSEPFGARSWWPCKDDPMDKPDSMDIFITIPDDIYNGHKLYAVSNGTLVSLIENENQTRTFHWHEQYPIATYLVSLAISNYQIYSEWYVTTENDSMPVIYYVYPEKIDNALANYDSTLDMIQTYSERFVPYPFFEEKYGMANFGWGGAMEHQTVSSMGIMNFWVVAHELAHQWFGNLVTCADFHHIWLNEGWATYLEAIYAEKLYGSDGYHTYMNAIAYYGLGKTIYIEDPPTEPRFDTIVYDKGAWVLHMLRFVMGDSLFFSATKGYLNNPLFKYKSATTSDFQSVMEQYYGSGLDWFFQQWIYGMGYPKYQYSWTYEQVDDHYVIDLTIKQVQEISGSEELFTMPLDVMIMEFPGVAKDTVQVWNDKRIQSFQLVTDLNPAEIELDPENWVLKRSKEVADIPGEEEALPFTYKLEQNYPNPFNPSTLISWQLAVAGQVDLIIYNILGERVITLVSERQPAGYHSVEWDAGAFPSGVYYNMIKSGEFRAVKKMVLLK
jgi:aminopeptidase N